ncbi:MAG: AAA family ATPase [Firmicutes bacterium]|nr:AAA family ATPase [Bacillota bacterium]
MNPSSLQPWVDRPKAGDSSEEHAHRSMRFTRQQTAVKELPLLVGDWRRIMNEWLTELDRLVGLEHVKSIAKEICAEAAVQSLRKEASLRTLASSRHMIFMGRPGTGKTTAARAIGQLLARLGILSRGHLVELERADLVGEYIGQTAQKTRKSLDAAQGGILFIDEAYALARGGEKDFGREAIDTIVKGMEDRRDDLLVILAGYPAEMQYFLSLNPGLHSRFPFHVTFPDFSERELIQIAEQALQERDYRLTVDARAEFRQVLRTLRDQPNFSNARTVRNVVERAMRKQAMRVVQLEAPTRVDLMNVLADDLRDGKGTASGRDRVYGGWKDVAQPATV